MLGIDNILITVYNLFEVFIMATAATLAKERYNLKNYDTVSVRFKKGFKKTLDFCASSSGKSLNSFVLDAVVHEIESNKASFAVQVRTNIRFKDGITYKVLSSIFKDVSLFEYDVHVGYFLAFFESCYPSLIKKFMAEQNITRDQVLAVLNMLPPCSGAVLMFREKIDNGEF